MENENKPDRTIFIGTKKPFMNYVTALVMELSSNSGKEVKVASRGNGIVKAVDVVRVVRSKDKSVTLLDVSIGSEKLERDSREGKKIMRDVSTIEITLKKE